MAHRPDDIARLDVPAVTVHRMRDGRVVESRMHYHDLVAMRDFLAWDTT
jgi:hypothetical protein